MPRRRAVTGRELKSGCRKYGRRFGNTSPSPRIPFHTSRAPDTDRKGLIRDAAKAGRDWPRVEKRMQEIRKALREHFAIPADPVPYIEGAGYQARFKIGCAPSFHT